MLADPVPQPPAHLSPAAAQWWTTTVEAYVLQEHHLRLLQLACEAWDRVQAARAQLEDEGLTVPGRERGIASSPLHCDRAQRPDRGGQNAART